MICKGIVPCLFLRSSITVKIINKSNLFNIFFQFVDNWMRRKLNPLLLNFIKRHQTWTNHCKLASYRYLKPHTNSPEKLSTEKLWYSNNYTVLFLHCNSIFWLICSINHVIKVHCVVVWKKYIKYGRTLKKTCMILIKYCNYLFLSKLCTSMVKLNKK